MKIMPYTAAPVTEFSQGAAQGIAARVVIGKQDGAQNFCMRVFENGGEERHPNHVEREGRKAR